MNNVHERMLLAGRYEVAGLLGVGGMGSVYRARDVELDEHVAVKVLRRELVAQPGMVERFRREVKLSRRVTHHNVARVFDIGEHGGDRFITMELVEGESLATRLARTGALPLREVIAIARAVADGLGAAHAAGVIHRDLKPDNVLLARDGRVVVTDFGIARASGAYATRTANVVVGTPEYMAPEQVEGSHVDARTDLYAFGALLFEMLTGRPPWTGESVLAIVAARLVGPPPDPRAHRDVPAPLAELVPRMLARAPADRPASAADVGAALGRIPLDAQPEGRARKGSLRPRAVAVRPVQRIAVVPLAAAPSQRTAAFAIAGLIAEALDGRPGVDVRARGVRLVPRAGADPVATGIDLDVPLVVGGSLDDAGAAHLALVNARDGFTLWSRTLPSASDDPFGVAFAAAKEIASALLVGDEPPPAEPPRDRRVVDLLVDARLELALAATTGPDAADRAIAKVERAYARAPADPWVNATYALALARRLAETEFVGDAEEALAMARAATTAAPRLAAGHRALGELLVDRGDLVSAARSAATAHALAPGDADVERLVAHLHVESGSSEPALALLRSAAAREVAPFAAEWDAARALFAFGRITEAEERLDAAVDADALTPSPWIARTRFGLWRGDRDRIAALREQLAAAVVADRAALLLALDAARGVVDGGAAIATLVRHSTAVATSRRRASSILALAADLAAFLGRTERAVELVDLLVRRGTVDVVWLLQAPTLAAARAVLAPAIEEVTARAQAIRAVLVEPYETLAGGPS